MVARGESARLVVHDGMFRVVVLKNPEPAHEDDVVHAQCIEQNLSGRGADVAAALDDLATNVAEMIAEEYATSLPEYEPNPDPQLVDAFERKSNEVDGCPVIRRGRLRVRLERVPVTSRGSKGKVKAGEISFVPDLSELAA